MSVEVVLALVGIIFAILVVIGAATISYFRMQLMLEKEKYIIEKRLSRLEALCFKGKK